MKQRLTILVSGMLCEVPKQGGVDWVVLQYLLGLRRLGHHVVFIEPIAGESLKPAGCGLARSINATYFSQVLEHFELDNTASLILRGTRETVGLGYDAVVELARSADVLLNISGRWTDKTLVDRIPIRVYLDLDPAFTQLWQVAHGIDMNLDGHTHHFTVGRAIGQADCNIPTCGRSWIPTNPPVVLHDWPVTQDIVHDGLTTIANWRGYG